MNVYKGEVMREDGVMWECTRCGRKEFQSYHPLKSKYPDVKPAEWLSVTQDIHLCGRCADAYTTILENFLKEGGAVIEED